MALTRKQTATLREIAARIQAVREEIREEVQDDLIGPRLVRAHENLMLAIESLPTSD